MGRFVTGGLVPFTWIYYFSHWGSWWIQISVSDFVCASARINARAGVRAWAFQACVSLSVWGSHAFMAVSDLAASQFDRARQPGGRQRWRDNRNRGWKKANTIFNEFPWLSWAFSGSGSPGWRCGWTEDYRADEKRLSQGLLRLTCALESRHQHKDIKDETLDFLTKSYFLFTLLKCSWSNRLIISWDFYNKNKIFQIFCNVI